MTDFLRLLLADAPTTRDLIVTPKPEDRRPCPHCRELAEEIRYEGAIVNVAPGDAGVRVHVPSVKAAVFLPCGHRFDGTTGKLIEADDA